MIDEAVAIRPKMYSIMDEKEKNVKKAKGVKKNVVEKDIQHKQYKEALFEKKQFWHGTEELQLLSMDGSKAISSTETTCS